MKTREARSNPCVLVQSRSAASYAAPHAPPGVSACRKGRATNANARDRYYMKVRITYIDHAIIRRHFHEAPGADFLQARMTGPGLHRVWMPGASLPPGLRAQALPEALEGKLSLLPAEYARVRVDDDVLLVETATRRIVDVMRNACAAHDDRERRVDPRDDRSRATGECPGNADENGTARWRLYDRVRIW